MLCRLDSGVYSVRGMVYGGLHRDVYSVGGMVLCRLDSGVYYVRGMVYLDYIMVSIV